MTTSLDRFLSLWFLYYYVLTMVPEVMILILEGWENTKNDKNSNKSSGVGGGEGGAGRRRSWLL